jgi:regulator of nonsense transcripts 2
VGLEQNEYGMQQKRIAHMRFLGELYNFRLIDSWAIFDTLYLILYFGYGTPEVSLINSFFS